MRRRDPGLILSKRSSRFSSRAAVMSKCSDSPRRLPVTGSRLPGRASLSALVPEQFEEVIEHLGHEVIARLRVL